MTAIGEDVRSTATSTSKDLVGRDDCCELAGQIAERGRMHFGAGANLPIKPSSTRRRCRILDETGIEAEIAGHADRSRNTIFDRQDANALVAAAERSAGLIRGAKLEVMESVGQFPPVEAFEVFDSLLNGFASERRVAGF